MPRLLLIGWDAADWKTLDRLVDQGDMPILKGLIERGTRGNLTRPRPVPLPMRCTRSHRRALRALAGGSGPPGRQRRRARNRL